MINPFVSAPCVDQQCVTLTAMPGRVFAPIVHGSDDIVPNANKSWAQHHGESVVGLGEIISQNYSAYHLTADINLAKRFIL